MSDIKAFVDKWTRVTVSLCRLFYRKSASMHVYDYTYNPKTRDWANGKVYDKIISCNRDAYLEYVKCCSGFMEYFQAISPAKQSGNDTDPFWINGWLPPFDAIVLYSLIAVKKPTIYMEIGSGNSTKFVRRAVSDHKLGTRIISIDPYPRAEIDNICDKVLRIPVENVPVETFSELNEGDVLFIDNSHRSFPNSDVTIFFMEILPNLKPGVIYGLHDIFLPNDYPEVFAKRYYNEQYLLAAYLLGGGGGGSNILFPVAYMSYRDEVKKALLGENIKPPWGDEPLHGGAFFMVKA